MPEINKPSLATQIKRRVGIAFGVAGLLFLAMFLVLQVAGVRASSWFVIGAEGVQSLIGRLTGAETPTVESESDLDQALLSEVSAKAGQVQGIADAQEQVLEFNIETIFNQLLTASGLTITGEANFDNDVTIAGDITAEGLLTLLSDLTVGGELRVEGDEVTSAGDLNLNPDGGGVSVGTGTPSIDMSGGDLYVTGDLEVDGSSTLGTTSITTGTFGTTTTDNSTISTATISNGTISTATITTLVINSESFTDLTGTGLELVDGALTSTLGVDITTDEIVDGTILAIDLNASNTPDPNNVLVYNDATGGFEWVDNSIISPWTDATGYIHTNTTGSHDVVITDTGYLGLGTTSPSNGISLADNYVLDLSLITHNDSARQGLKLPQNSSLTTMSGVGVGEGYLAYDTTVKKVKVFNGTNWTDISGASTTLQEAYEALNTLNVTAGEGNLAVTLTSADFTIDTTGGNVGIGTTSPGTDLDVAGSTTLGATSGHQVIFNAGALSLVNQSTLDLVNSTVNALSIESGLLSFDTTNSRLGVGTTAPAALLDLAPTQTSGTIFNIHYPSNTNLTGDLTGAIIDLDDGTVVPTNQNVTSLNAKLPTTTNTHTTGTKYLRGVLANFGTGSGINQTGAGGTTVFNAFEADLPALTQSAGSLSANGVYIDLPSGITTGGTATGVNINATGVGAGSLYGAQISSITGGAGSEYALSIGSGWDSVLRVNGTEVIDSAGVTQEAGGGTGQSTYAQGDILYASAANTLSKLAVGSTGHVLTVSGSGVPTWGTVDGSSCVTCLINNPSSDQTISPTADAVGLSVRQSNAGSPTADIFSVASNDGLSKYFYVDADGVVNIPNVGSFASDQLIIEPGTDKFALQLLGTNVTAATLQLIDAYNTSGTLFDIDYPVATALSGTLYAQDIDLGTNVTATNQSVFGTNLTLPSATNTHTTGTKYLTGLKIQGSGGLNQNGTGGTTTFSGLDITIPALTQTAGTINGYGLQVTTPSSITSGGTAAGLYVNASGVGAGSLYGVDISGITAGAGSQRAINIGSGWPYGIYSQATENYFSGEIGIGTTSPSQKLHVVGNAFFDTSAGDLTIRNTGSSSVEVYSSGSLIFDTASSQSMAFEVGNTRYATLYLGKFGIGTTSPADTLDILSTSDSQLRLSYDSTNYQSLRVFNDGGTSWSALGTDADLNFNFTGATDGDFSINTDHLFVDTSAGNTGIGTTNPLAKLEVKGSADVNQFSIMANGTQSNSNQLLVLKNSAGSVLSGFHADHVNSLFLGVGAGENNNITGIGSEGLYNIFVGPYAGNMNTTGAFNTVLGNFGLYNNDTGSNNTAVGYSALYFTDGGSYNTGLGRNALEQNTTGSDNVGVGYRALARNSTGSGNTGVGVDAGNPISGGSYSGNSMLGYRTGFLLDTGSNNTLLGYQAGDNLTTGSNNIVLGYNIDAPAATSTQTLNIGNLLFGTGLDGSGTTLSTGSIGIGTTGPGYKLDVVSGAAIAGRFDGRVIGVDAVNTDEFVTLGQITTGSSGLWTRSGTDTYLTNTGDYVGIGTTDPAVKLDLSGTSSDELRLLSSTAATPKLHFRGSVYDSFIYQDSSGHLRFDTESSTPALILLQNGNVGIGTTSPGAQLQINTTAAGTIGQIIKGFASQTADLLQVQNSSAQNILSVSPYTTLIQGRNTAYESLIVQSTPGANQTANVLEVRDRNDANLFTINRYGNVNISSSGTGKTALNISHTGDASRGVALSHSGGSSDNYGYRLSMGASTAGVGNLHAYSFDLGTGNGYGVNNYGLKMDFRTASGATNIYGLYMDSITSGSSGNYAILTNAGDVVFNEGGDAGTDLRIEGDTDTNLFFTDASADAVGIGTSSPHDKLEILSTTDAQLRLAYDATNYTALQVAADGGNTWSALGTDADLNFDFSGATDGDFSVNTDDLFVDTSTSRVGVGTTAPGALMHIYGNNYANLRLEDTTYNSDYGFYTGVNNQDAIGIYDFDTPAYRLTINSSGYVGIGSNAGDPASIATRLHVMDTTTQLRLGYDASNYTNFTVGSDGSLVLASNGTTGLTISSSKITSHLPHEFLASGDVSMAYDLNFTNITSSGITSDAPLLIAAGESFNSDNLTLQTYNTGDIVLDLGRRLYATTDNASGYVAEFYNDGNNANRYGLKIQAGADDASGTTYYLDAYDGDGNQVGYIANTSGTFALTDVSDIRTKVNVTDTRFTALDILNDLRVVDYNRKQNPDGPQITGFIAQEVNEVFPDAVTVGADGLLGIRQASFIPLTIKAIQEQQLQIATIDESGQVLGAKIDELGNYVWGSAAQDQLSTNETVSSLSKQVEVLTNQLTGLGDGDLTTLITREEMGQNISWTQTAISVLRHLVVEAAATFKQTVTFLAEVTFRSSATFEQAVSLQDELKLGQNSAGVVTIPARATEVKVKFQFDENLPEEERHLSQVPVVTLTPVGQVSVWYWLDSVTDREFSIKLATPVDQPLTLNWTAVMTTGDGLELEVVSSQPNPLVSENPDPEAEPTQDESSSGDDLLQPEESSSSADATQSAQLSE